MLGKVKTAIKRPDLVMKKLQYALHPKQSENQITKDADTYWNASSEADDVQDMSHWLGRGRWEDERLWRSVGEDHYDLIRRQAIAHDLPVQGQTMLEWGPGGGANLVTFAKHYSQCYTVDLSKPNLEECNRRLVSEGHAPAEAIHIDPEQPEVVREKLGSILDLFLCTAVYQHMPSREYGLRINQIAYDLLKPGGLALIQTRFDDGNRKYKSKQKDYKQQVTFFTSYTLEEFWRHLETLGFDCLSLTLKTQNNYAFYFAQKRK